MNIGLKGSIIFSTVCLVLSIFIISSGNIENREAFENYFVKIQTENIELKGEIKELRKNAFVAVSKSEVEWMAKCIYFESRGESLAGQMAVAMVVLNRVRDDRFPNTVEEVVKQKDQFSWFWDGLSDEPKDSEAFENCLGVALLSFTKIADFTDASTHFHTIEVSPKWSRVFTRVCQIDNHIFYRWEIKKYS